MKKALAIIIPIVIILLAGTAFLFYYMGSNAKTPAAAGAGSEVTAKMADAEFIKSLGKALKARADFTTAKQKEYAKKPETYDEQAYRKEVLNQEQGIKDFISREFENPRLAQLSKDYINGLETQEKSLDYYSTDYVKYQDLWKEGYGKRSISIVALQEEFGLDVPKEIIEEFKSVAKTTTEEQQKEKAIKQMIAGIEFEETEASYGYKTYAAVVENTTEFSFDYVSLTINLTEDDVVVESAYSSINNWEAGQKAKFEFTTDKAFDKYKVTGDWYISEN